MAERHQDKLEAAAEAAGAAAAAAAASVWRFFDDEALAKKAASGRTSSTSSSSSSGGTSSTEPALACARAGTATPQETEAAAASNGLWDKSCNKDFGSSNNSTTAPSKDTSPSAPVVLEEPTTTRTNSNINSNSTSNSSIVSSISSNGVNSNSSSNDSSNSDNKNSASSSGKTSSSSGTRDFVSAFGMLRTAANRALGAGTQEQQQDQQQQQQRQGEAAAEFQSFEELPPVEDISAGAPAAPAAAAALSRASAPPAPGAAAAAAAVAAAVAAAEAAFGGGSKETTLASSSTGGNSSSSSSSAVCYQTSTTPEAIQVTHRVPQQQERQDHASAAAAAGTEAAAAPEGAATAAAAAAAGIRKLAETRLGYATDIGGQLQQTAQQTAAKKHSEEDASSASWYNHKRHAFIFSYSGKPVYSRYGKEENLGAFTGTLSAIVSKLERLRGDKPHDVLRHFRCGGGRFVVLCRGPFYLVLFSQQSLSNSTARGYLMLLHRQLLFILTKEVERTLLIRPSFDVRPLMGGTDGIFRGLHHLYFHSMLSVLLPILLQTNCSAATAGGATADHHHQQQHQQQQQQQQGTALAISGAFEPLPLSSTMRHIANTGVRNCPTSNVLASMLLAEQRVIAMAFAKGYELSPTDVCLLTNVVNSSLALRQLESWTPLCIPTINERAFIHAYVRYVTPRVAFVCISSPADGVQFYDLANHCNKLFAMLTNTGCLAAIETSLEYAPYALPRTLWAEAEIVHCSLFVCALNQFYASAFSEGYAEDRAQQQRVYSLYISAAELILHAKRPAHSYIETTDEKVYVWLTPEFFFFCCVPRWIDLSTALVEQLAKWIREQKPFLFISDIPTITLTPPQK